MNIIDFSVRMRLTRIDLELMLSSNDISDKRRMGLSGLKAKYAAGDEVLYYCSEREAWDVGMGSEGYILVRDNEIIDNLVVRMN